MDRFVQEFSPSPSDVVICGSMAHKEQWLGVIARLRDSGLIVSAPDLNENTDWSSLSDRAVIQQKGWLVRRHFANIATAKAVLICNYEKKGVDNYIGSNSFLEMGAGFIYGKPVYILNDIPQQDNREEILALEPIVLKGDLNVLIEEVKK